MENKIILGNCLKVVPELNKFDLIFADFPFNIDQKYIGYNDKQPKTKFEDFVSAAVEVLINATNGILCLHGNDYLCEQYLVAANKFNLKRVAWCNWHYRFGQNTRSNWIDARCHLLIYAIKKDYTWNPENVLVESDRVKYKDKRIHETERGGKRLPGTVWGVPSDGLYWSRVMGTSKERWKNHPNQLPIRYLQRIIFAYTNVGDRVLDPFVGSGTTGLVCWHENRNFIGIDISEYNTYSARDRIRNGFYREP